MALHELPSDILRRVVLLLCDMDMAQLSMSCRRARKLVAEEPLWEQKVSEIVRNDPAFQAISEETTESLRAWLGGPSFKVIYKLFVSLGLWPEGIWREQPSLNHKQRCKGSMHKISCIPGGVFLAETFANQRHAPSFQLTLQEREERWPVLRLAAYNGELSPAYWQTVNVALVEPGPQSMPQGTPARMKGSAAVPLSRWRPYKPSRNDADRLEHQGPGSVILLFCCHMPPLPFPNAVAPLPAAPGLQPSADAILGRLQGMYSTYYGPHGMEFLHITYGDMDLPLANLLPHGKCFAGLKVTGDPNVPAGKLSFCVSADNVKLGSYSGFEHEEVAPGEYANVYRDIVRFGPGDNFELVAIEERPVIARYYGLGQINASTQLWAPKWVEVQVIAYSDVKPTFSLLWADPGRHWRHIMDFTAMQLSRRPALCDMPQQA
ncbi:hypothetical protein CVIRNUC_002717 [Coccomyxa viridis]|uniref:F-box domain-containing protein n=1 Tax=Coccomyxa viridis TaxID=1274662 RepID=A0AAV1HXB0_9CHLO|nr:hypothetical protein CVIRNUC_002717 [Coccomyxa viridis]